MMGAEASSPRRGPGAEAGRMEGLPLGRMWGRVVSMG